MKIYHFCMIALIISLFSCKKNNVEASNFSAEIQNLVPQAVIDSMRKYGMTINEGKTPPIVTGIYNFSKNLCTFDNSGQNAVNRYFSDYRFRFRDQDNQKLTISVDYKALSVSDTANGAGSFLSGTGDEFTIFVEQKGVASNVSYQALLFYSGTKTSTGIKNFQFAGYLKEKSADPLNVLTKVGTTRIFKDEDGLSGTVSAYRVLFDPKAMLAR